MVESRCGILCKKCEYKEKTGCRGCVNIEKPFWGGNCPVKSCCEEKGNIHCGMCSEFPCELLLQYSYDNEQGDSGKRIVQCRCWGKECRNNCGWLDTYLRGFPSVTRDYKEEWKWIRYQIGGKMFAIICKDATGTRDIITIKLDIMDGEFLRRQYKDIVPGHYMNKAHWNSIYLDGSVPADMLKELIEKSYYLVLARFSKKKQKEILGER